MDFFAHHSVIVLICLAIFPRLIALSGTSAETKAAGKLKSKS